MFRGAFHGRRSMSDFIVALGLVLVIEGLIFAVSPSAAKNAMAHVLDTADGPLRLVGIGATVGWAVAFLVAIHVMRGAPINLVIFLGVPALLMLVAAGASWLPARRASRVDPVVALRAEN